MDIITSTQNDKVKLAHALQARTRTRKKENKVVLEGVRLIRDAWHNSAQPDFILYTNGTDDEFVDKLARTGIEVFPVDEAVMRHVTDTQSPQGIVGVFLRPQSAYPPDAQHVLVLDAIADPGNIGTMLRTAAGAGVDAVVLAPGCVDLYNPKVLRGGMGAHFRLPIVELSWSEVISTVTVDHVYLADTDAPTRYDQADWRGMWALVVGSEAHGASEMAQRFARTPISIPMARQTESLNAAVATAVILFEAARQLR